MFALSEQLSWTLIGLILTIASTWLEAFTVWFPFEAWLSGGAGAETTYPLGVTFQIGAVLFTGCMGGKNAAALSQIAYVLLGLVLYERFGLEVFSQGGGLGYFREPSFGYLLGFIPAGWVCGMLAFRAKRSLERLAFASICGVLVVHLCGLSYLVLGHLFRWLPATPALGNAMLTYSVERVPAQMMVSCAITLIAWCLRKAMFY